MEFHQTLGYTRPEVIPLLTAELLKQLEEIDEKWQKATGYPWLNEEDCQEMVKEAERDCEPDFTLEDLLAGITPENVHEEIRTGKPRGKEIW